MNTCIFTTHATLNLVHAEYSLKALLQLQDTDIVWNHFKTLEDFSNQRLESIGI